MRKSVGPPLATMPDTETLFRAAADYEAWAVANPIVRRRVLASGAVTEVHHDRPLTFEGLIAHSGIAPSVFERLHVEQPDIYNAIRARFFEYQYSRAATGAFDRELVMRYFGMIDKRHVQAQITVARLSDAELDEEVKALMATLGEPMSALFAPPEGKENLAAARQNPTKSLDARPEILDLTPND
jgi:hypothetical protein